VTAVGEQGWEPESLALTARAKQNAVPTLRHLAYWFTWNYVLQHRHLADIRPYAPVTG
jgi:hypothetical protein